MTSKSSATTSRPRLDEYDELITGQPIFRQRMEGVGRITADEALALSATGPILRSTGVAWDLRRSMPYLAYDQVEFDVIVVPTEKISIATPAGSTRSASRSELFARCWNACRQAITGRRTKR